MRSNNSFQTMNVVLVFHNLDRSLLESFAFDDVINKLLKDNASAIEQRPDKNVIEKPVPDVDEEKRCESSDDLVKHRRAFLAHSSVNVLEKEFVQTVVEPLPHV